MTVVVGRLENCAVGEEVVHFEAGARCSGEEEEEGKDKA